MMEKLDEGLDDFFSKRVVKLSFRLPSIRSPSTPTPEASDKKRESRKSGFFNLIKSRTSRSEKSHGAPAITPPHPAHANTTTTSPVTEEAPPTSPILPAKCPISVVEPHQEIHGAQSANHTDSEMEAPPTSTEPAGGEKDTRKVEDMEILEKKESPPKKENIEKKENPHIHRHIGIPMMGKDLLAEMKARQEKRQDKMAEKKSDSSSVLDKVDSDKPKSNVHPAVSTDPEDSKLEPIPRAKPPKTTPKPAPAQTAKAPLVARTCGQLSPTSPRPFSISVIDDSVESAPGSVSPKAPLPAPRLKRAPSEQDRESTSSSSAGLLSPLEAEFSADGDAFGQPSIPGADSGISGRQWSSLKSSSGPLGNEEERERTKSLPGYVRLPSQTDMDLSPAGSEISTLSSDLKSNNKSEDESGDDTPSM